MNINTRTCVEEIIKTLPSKLWKRKSKRRAPMMPWSLSVKEPAFSDLSNGMLWLREFVSVDHPGMTAFVWANQEKIIHLKFLTELKEAKSKFYQRKDLGKPYFWCIDDEFDDKTPEFCTPVVILSADMSGDEEDVFERLDMENYEVLKFHSDGCRVDMEHGGDWQEPMRVTYRLMSDGNFYLEGNPKKTLCKQQDDEDENDE